jgi:hypothetical protein
MKAGGDNMLSLRRTNEIISRIVPFFFLVVLLLISGCATTSVLLDTNILSAEEMRSAAASQQKFNALRVEPRGGRWDELIGYVLYKDGVDVRIEGPAQNRGKLTLSEALAEYERYLRHEYVSHQARAIVSGIAREGAVIGYTLIGEGLDFDLWEDISQKDPSKISLILYFEDIRIAD